MSTRTQNLGLFKYNTTTDTAVPFSIDNALNANWDIIDEKCGAGKNIGEIVVSTIPLTDAGLHLLDGSLINGNGSYSAFVTYMVGLETTYPDLFTTEASWQEAVTNYGVCGKFVYDSTNNTIRLPKITGILEGTTDLTALGDLVEAGLPNITGTANITGVTKTSSTSKSTYNFNTSGAITADGQNYNDSISRTDNNSWFGTAFVNIDASRSSSIYGNSDTVQPQTIKVLYYIVIATSTKTNIQVDIDEIATDLNSKVDKSDLQEVQCVVETYQNGTSWYRIYSDGWCEQGGTKAAGAVTITFLKPFVDTNYYFNEKVYRTGPTGDAYNYYNNKTTNSITILQSSETGFWFACGYIEV